MRNWGWRREVAFGVWEGRCREEKKMRAVDWSTSPQRRAAFPGLQSSPAPESPKATQKALAN